MGSCKQDIREFVLPEPNRGLSWDRPPKWSQFIYDQTHKLQSAPRECQVSVCNALGREARMEICCDWVSDKFDGSWDCGRWAEVVVPSGGLIATMISIPYTAEAIGRAASSRPNEGALSETLIVNPLATSTGEELDTSAPLGGDDAESAWFEEEVGDIA